MAYNYDPELATVIEFLPLGSMEDPIAARVGMQQAIAMFAGDVDETGVSIVNRSIPGSTGAPDVAIRIYRPENLAAPTAGLLYIHGGGFVVGDLDTEHAGAVGLCRELGIVVVSVDYRLAPEHPYPAAIDDCYAALLWTHANAGELHLDPQRLGVIGQSAGGGLAAGLALLARDRQGPALCFQYLGIPELDDRLRTRSMQKFVDTPMWHRPNAEISWKYYLGEHYQAGSDDVPPYAAPARALNLTGLPPAHITTMEFDPLRDEGILYALHLLQAGVSVELHNYPGTFHGSSLVASAAVSRQERADMHNSLRKNLRLG